MSSYTGKLVIIAGLILALIGVIIYFFYDKLHWIGNLPGDIKIERKNFRFYFPITTMVLFSLLINMLIRLFRWIN
ncbi:DUF2905 domain-containing protein [Desertivirga xinjiangensis]|uniref:DUF2905 domain-containing protein n=1 Tax=Desertivirga xinjiangensis TaxID=539206 RepID=UPI00210CECE2|nr:DUF2905 domain-containing protein [Pedobacter xinjiangensis]